MVKPSAPVPGTSCVCPDKKLLSNKAFLDKTLETLMVVRKFEEKVFELFGKGMVHGTTHLGIGEEATGVGSTFALKPQDYMLATHRGHGQAIGKGCDVNLMMAEILARAPGICRGRGGSMHIADFDKGILGANAPLGCGAALTIQKKKLKDTVAVAFFGDGASNEGAIHESMNLAAAWQLPIIFCIINNTYGMSTPLEKVVHELDLTKRAIGYGMKSMECDGNDVLQVYDTMRKARAHVLKKGPILVVEHTYRTSGHSKSDGNLYRSKDEIANWKSQNPVVRFSNFLLENGLSTSEKIAAADEKSTKIIDDAVAFALASPDPVIEDALGDVYA